MNTETLALSTDYSKIDAQVRSIITAVSRYMPRVDPSVIAAEIMRAYHYARNAHEGQFRKSGDPYISHPVEAILIMLSLRPDLTTIQACLLHDVAEDTSRTIDDIRAEF